MTFVSGHFLNRRWAVTRVSRVRQWAFSQCGTGVITIIEHHRIPSNSIEHRRSNSPCADTVLEWDPRYEDADVFLLACRKILPVLHYRVPGVYCCDRSLALSRTSDRRRVASTSSNHRETRDTYYSETPGYFIKGTVLVLYWYCTGTVRVP
jgi:hypothetical protein